MLGTEPEGLAVGSDGVISIRARDMGIRLTLRVEDAFAIGQILNEFVAKSILLDLAQPPWPGVANPPRLGQVCAGISTSSLAPSLILTLGSAAKPSAR